MARAKDALLLSNGPLELETGVKPGRSATNTSTPCGLGEVQLWEEWPKLKKQIKKVPTLREFSKRLREYAERYTKPGTARFYRSSTENLFSFDALADARLDAVNGELITAYVRSRKAAKLSTARINGELRTLRRILSLAADWQLIPYRTAVHELPNEEKRDRVLTYKEEQFYLLHSTDNLRDATIITVDRGLRPNSELFVLEWPDIHFEQSDGPPNGFLHVREGKSKNAVRNVPLTPRVREVLAAAVVAAAKRARVCAAELPDPPPVE